MTLKAVAVEGTVGSDGGTRNNRTQKAAGDPATTDGPGGGVTTCVSVGWGCPGGGMLPRVFVFVAQSWSLFLPCMTMVCSMRDTVTNLGSAMFCHGMLG